MMNSLRKMVILTLLLAVLTTCGIFAQKPAGKPPVKSAVDREKLNKMMNAFSQVRVFIEFYFMESGYYPDSLEQLVKDMNSLLPRDLPKVDLPTDPLTGKNFIYARSENRKSYTLKVADPSAYGIPALEVSPVNWAGYYSIAEERRFRFLAMINIENMKALATSIEYYAKDHKGKFPSQLKDLIPTYIKTMPVSPVTGQFYIYEADGNDYSIVCPEIKELKMDVLMFSSKRGWVTK